VELLATEAPEPQHFFKVILQVVGAGEALVAHQQTGGIHELGVGRGLHGQQSVEHIPVEGVEGMALLGHS
jgi:hypothetical protein